MGVRGATRPLLGILGNEMEFGLTEFDHISISKRVACNIRAVNGGPV